MIIIFEPQSGVYSVKTNHTDGYCMLYGLDRTQVLLEAIRRKYASKGAV